MARGELPIARTIAWAGAVVGTLDITDALLFTWMRGVPPVRVLYAIASGVLGPDAANGGGAAAALGLALHFFIAYTVATVFIAAAGHLPWLLRHVVPVAMAYGIGVMLVMQSIVLPLAGFSGGLGWRPASFNLVFAHLFCVGLPIGLIARRFSSSAPLMRPSLRRGGLSPGD
jgi:hypothetical protein